MELDAISVDAREHDYGFKYLHEFVDDYVHMLILDELNRDY